MRSADSELGVADFEEKHMISIMIYLETHSPSRKIELYDAVSTNPRMPDKLNHLERMGMLTQDIDPETRSTFVSITPLGSKVAKMFLDVDDMMRSEGKRR